MLARYLGPRGAFEIDGRRLERGGEAVQLTAAQWARCQSHPDGQFEDVTPPAKAKKE